MNKKVLVKFEKLLKDTKNKSIVTIDKQSKIKKSKELHFKVNEIKIKNNKTSHKFYLCSLQDDIVILHEYFDDLKLDNVFEIIDKDTFIIKLHNLKLRIKQEEEFNSHYELS